MNNNNLVVIERDMFCPYCETNSGVLISETVKSKSIIGCAPVGIRDGCLLTVTGGCWALISGLPLYDIKTDHVTNLYGFCPCCGNTFPVIKPNQEKNAVERFQDARQNFSNMANQVKGMINKDNDNT